MNRIDIETLARRESEQVEWKENVADLDEVVQSVVAFANDFSNLGGGYVVCGIHETKDGNGFQKMEKVGLSSERFRKIEGHVLNACTKHVDPPLTPLVEELPSDAPGKKILVFIVAATGWAHCHRTSRDTGKYYIRSGRRTIEARNGLLRELLVRKGLRDPWDRRWPADAVIEDLDLVAFRDLLQRMGVWDPAKGLDEYLDPSRSLSPFVPSFCVRDNLTGVLRPRNFALLLFGREVNRFFPEAHAVLSIYPGADKSEPYAERLEFGGGLARQAEALVDRLNAEAYLVMDKSSDHAPNIVKYPRRALHEAVINALVHRDYEAKHPVRVTVFSNRVEIWSPGSLPSAVDPDRFQQGIAMPVWRNQAMAWILTRLQLAQAEGQGIATILRSMKDEGCPLPRFDLGNESVMCTLPAHPRHARMRDLQEVERLVAIDNLLEAHDKLDKLLQEDPYNFRTIRLFCEIQQLSRDPAPVLDFILKHEKELSKFSAVAQVILADTITQDPEHLPARARDLASRLLKMAAKGHFEEAEARRLVISLLRMGHIQEALDVLRGLFAEYSYLNEDPAFLQLRGRAKLQLAKKCSLTAASQRRVPRLQKRTWDECRAYLDEAERDLRAALEYHPDGNVMYNLQADLHFLEVLSEKARQPRRTR